MLVASWGVKREEEFRLTGDLYTLGCRDEQTAEAHAG